MADDCAILEIGSETLVLTHDMMAEGTHYLPDADPFDVAWKLVATNLSDLAAKGADPVGVLLGYSLSDKDERFIEGLQEALIRFDVPLMGGDTIRAKGPATHGLTAIGRATHTPVPSREGAKVGDAIYVTGELGRALLGFEGDQDHSDAFSRPTPRLKEGQALAPLVTAMMDVSDGLLLDCWRLAEASNATCALESKLIPVAKADRFNDCIRWGDDYELLCTAPANSALLSGVKRIGWVCETDGDRILVDGQPLAVGEKLGFQHT